MKQQHFISGLPRSGSTLLASLLSQNPKFYTDIASPVNAIVEAHLHTDTFGFNQILTPAKTKELIKNTFDVMYGDNDKEIIFDTNRCWSGKLEVLHDIFPEAKVICCVRDIKSILNSFEHIYRQNPYQSNSSLYGPDNVSVYTRSQSLLSAGGVLGVGLNNLKQGIHSAHKDMLYIVEYDDLVEDTEAVLESIYELLGFEPFEHDLNNVKNIENTKVVDDNLLLPNLHTVRKVVCRQDIPNYIPHDLATSLENIEYWRLVD
jgi:sulfotransferase